MAEVMLWTLSGLVCGAVALWLCFGAWYWIRVGWRWARRYDGRGR